MGRLDFVLHAFQVWYGSIHSLPFLSFSYSCQEGETKELWSSGHHLKSCRAVGFSEDGQSEYWGRQEAVWERLHGNEQYCKLGLSPQNLSLSLRTKQSMY